MNTLILVAVLGQSWSWQDSIRHAKPAIPVVTVSKPASKCACDKESCPCAPCTCSPCSCVTKKKAELPAPPTNNLLRSPDCNCPPYECRCEIPCRCAAPPKVAAKPAESPPAALVPRAEPYRRKDASGQVWRYPPEGSTREVIPADLEILDTFIRGRNSAIGEATAITQAPPTRPASTAFNPQAWLGNSSVQPQQYAAPLAFAPIQQGYGYGQGMPMMFGAGGGACGPGGCN